jgi:hypothetical protein
MAVLPSVLGETLVTMLKMLMSTRKRVTRRAILPGTTGRRRGRVGRGRGRVRRW